MISFIIIAYNEGSKLTNCIQSIFNAIEKNKLNDFEIIFVDSGSSDDSIEHAQQFPGLRIYLITGIHNAAIARNIGARESVGDILFFIDGDMEIEDDFISRVVDDKDQLKYDNVTGHLNEYFYDNSGDFLWKAPRTYKSTLPSEEMVPLTSGGIFVIKKENWNLVKGMRTKYKRSQDSDLTLRLAMNGIRTIRVPHLIAKHHTIDYRNEKRMWQLLLSGNDFYPALLFRDHFFNLKMIIRTVRHRYTSFLMLLIPFGALISRSLLFSITALYMFILLLKVLKHTIGAATNNTKFSISWKEWSCSFCEI